MTEENNKNTDQTNQQEENKEPTEENKENKQTEDKQETAEKNASQTEEAVKEKTEETPQEESKEVSQEKISKAEEAPKQTEEEQNSNQEKTDEQTKTTAETPAEAPKEEQPAEATEQNLPEIKPGMVVRVHQKIRETNPKGEEKERIQVFEGRVLARKHGNEAGATITVRKISGGIGVEKIFPIHSPNVVKIEPVKQAKVKRSKLYFLRNWKKKLKETLIK